jgi:hypothetical protein
VRRHRYAEPDQESDEFWIIAPGCRSMQRCQPVLVWPIERSPVRAEKRYPLLAPIIEERTVNQATQRKLRIRIRTSLH